MQRRSWGQDIQPALENGLLERGGRRCGWEPFRKPFRGLLIHKGGGTVGQGTAFGLLHIGICMVRGSQVFSAGYGARMQRGVILF